MGISIERVAESSILQHLKCSICRELLEGPKMIKACEHNFCKKCIAVVQNGSNSTCPECRIPFSPLDILKFVTKHCQII